MNWKPVDVGMPITHTRVLTYDWDAEEFGIGEWTGKKWVVDGRPGRVVTHWMPIDMPTKYTNDPTISLMMQHVEIATRKLLDLAAKLSETGTRNWGRRYTMGTGPYQPVSVEVLIGTPRID